MRELSSTLLSVESWLIAEWLSVANTSILDRAVKIGAQCMATVITSQRPPDEQSRSILMRHLTIEELLLNRYLEPFDSLLLKNLNLFLENTAFDVISDENSQHLIDIVLLTVRLAKQLKIEHATVPRSYAMNLRGYGHGFTSMRQNRPGKLGIMPKNCFLSCAFSLIIIRNPHLTP